MEKGRSEALKICLSEFLLKPTALVMSFRKPMYREWRFRRKRVKRIIAEMFFLKKKGKNSINVVSDLKYYNSSYDIILDQLI